MNLVELRIERERYGKNQGQHTGKIVFDNKNGEVSLRLTPEHVEKIFQLCADAIIDTAKTAASDMTCSVLEHQKSIEEVGEKEDSPEVTSA
jgi:uncharacterized protein YutE (UPF0331/DUF86 family)